jgi:hypothetical protein
MVRRLPPIRPTDGCEYLASYGPVPVHGSGCHFLGCNGSVAFGGRADIVRAPEIGRL